jgi:hypothetical protein
MKIFSAITIAIWVGFFSWLGYLGNQNYNYSPFENSSSVVVGSSQINNQIAPRVLVVKRTYDVGQPCHIGFVRYIVSNESDGQGDFENSRVGDHEIVVQTGWFDRDKIEKGRVDIINIPIVSAYPAGHYSLYTHYNYHCNFMDVIFPRTLLEKLAEFDVVE